MPKKYSEYSEEEKYDICKTAIESASKVFGNENNADFSFQKEELRVNLLSVRGFKDGAKVTSRNDVFDDILYVIYINGGKKHVDEYAISTEFGTSGTALLVEGQYRYWLGNHLSSKYPNNQPLKNGYAGGKNYRALKINQIEGATVLRDSNRDLSQNENEKIEKNNYSINIHYGGEKENTSNWSLGCQVIRGWENFKAVIKTIESDHSIIGTINNELAEKPATDGTRYVVYTLIKGEEFEKSFNTGVRFPVELTEGANEFNNENIKSYYNHTEKETEGGYFPVGSNTLWHGGLHIFKDEGTEIFACMPGKVIAGRLTDDATLSTGPFGHRNFLLLEHTVKEKKCFSLYMHLKDNPLNDSDEFVKKVKWLQGAGKKSFKITGNTRNYRSSPDSSIDTNKLGSLNKGDLVDFVEDATPAPWKKVKLSDGSEVFLHCDSKYVEECASAGVDKDLLESLKKGDVVKIDKEIKAGDLLWKMGKYGPKDEQKGLVHWEIFSEENLVADGDESEPAIEDKKPEGVSTGYTSAKGVKVRGVTGPAKAKEGQAVTCIVTKIDYSDAPATELDKIKWDITIDGIASACSTTGYKLEYTIPGNSVGKTIKIRPYMNSPSDSYSVSISVIDSWTCIEDPDDDFNAENDTISQFFGDLMADGTLTREELKQFYSENPEGKVEKLRNYACKFASEWGVKDLAAAISELKRMGFAAKEDDYKPYLWWQEAVSAGVKLPSENVWHYNPVRFLEVFGQASAGTSPQESPAPAATSATVGVKKCEGPETVDVLEKGTYKVTEFNGTPTNEQKKNVNWIVFINGEERKKFEKCGEVLEFEIPDTWAGDEIAVHPYINKPSPDLKVTTKVGPFFLFDGKELAAYSVKSTKGISWPACSGENNVTDPTKEHGPIPEGKYLIEKSNIQMLPGMMDRMFSSEWDGGADYWGEKRIQIFSFGAKTFGRNRFFIHGGKKMGSGFGIDLTDKIEDFVTFMNALKRDKIVLVVKSTSANTSTIPQATDNVHTDWKLGFNRDISKQNEYNDLIYKYTKDTSVNPFIFKSLIAQESAFKKDAHNNMGYAGLTQIGNSTIADSGLKIAGTKRVTKTEGKKVKKVWEYDLENDERFKPDKSIEAGVKILKKKIISVNNNVFSKYTVPPSEEEKWKFYLAAYNGGEGTVKKAYLASKVTNATWNDIINGKETSALWGAIPEEWGREGKYKEISNYPLEILKRAKQNGTAGGEYSPASTASESAKTDSLKKGNYDDVAVKKYPSKKTGGTGYVAGNNVEKLQKDLIAVGLTEVGTADGDFGKKTEDCVKKFQEYALKDARHTSNSSVSAPVTFKGKADGVADKITQDELALWISKGYKIVGETPAAQTATGEKATSKDQSTVLTFPGTSFKHCRPKRTLQSCLDTLSPELRADFKETITTIIKEMYNLGIAFGVTSKPKSGYRTFEDQYNIDPTKTKAGPGESMHNYAVAVDLGVLEWADDTGKTYSDFWLGTMDKISKYKGFSSAIWKKRNSFGNGKVHDLSFEIIHLQGVVSDYSGKAVLVKAMNQAAQELGDTNWTYKSVSGGYQCTLGDRAAWHSIGNSKQMWSSLAINCTSLQRQIIKKHMIKAEEICKTMAL